MKTMLPAQLHTNTSAQVRTGLVQRKCACGGVCDSCRSQRLSAPRPFAAAHAPTGVPPIVQDVLQSPGQLLDTATRSYMEPRFGHDFSQVRVHTDARAQESARAVNALAYTVGRDMVFGQEQFRPETRAGQRLLAHELTHVAQQASLSPSAHGASSDTLQPRLTLDTGSPNEPLEQQAEQNAEAVTRGKPARGIASEAPGLVRRVPRGGLEDSAGEPRERHGSTLPYREATELVECLRIMGDENRAYCYREVLGETIPTPEYRDVPGISTPQPFTSRPNAAGEVRYAVNGVPVVFLPDTTSAEPRLANKAETNFSISAFSINYQATNGRVNSFTGPGAVEITAQTTYGTGVSATSTSGYGRGTTADDRQMGNTSLRFHEGRHGLDFVRFLRTHPFPQFTGRIGMTVVAFEAAMTAYRNARNSFSNSMKEFSVQSTDCVGTTIDQFNQTNGQITVICHHP